jgi:hypothetical protein
VEAGYYIAEVRGVGNKVFKTAIEIHLRYLVTSGPYAMDGQVPVALSTTKNLATELLGRFVIKTKNRILAPSPFCPYHKAWVEAVGREPQEGEAMAPQVLLNQSFWVEVGPRSDSKPELVVRRILWKTGWPQRGDSPPPAE